MKNSGRISAGILSLLVCSSMMLPVYADNSDTAELAPELTMEQQTDDTAEEPASEEIVSDSGDIKIDDEHFPDAKFRDYVYTKLDRNQNGYLSQDEIKNIREIDISTTSDAYQTVTDMTGIEYFTSLETLKCDYNKLSKLDLSKNTALKYLSCTNAGLTVLNISGCSQLTDIYCSNNSISVLDVTGKPQLKNLICNSNKITSLNVSGSPLLGEFECESNQLTEFDVSRNTQLYVLNCGYNRFTTLNVENCPALSFLSCRNTKITSLDLSNQHSLKVVSCADNDYTIDTVKGRYFLKNLLGHFDVSITDIRISGNCVLVYYSDNSVDEYNLDDLPDYIIDEMADRDIQYVVDYVNAFSDSSDNKVLTDAQLYAIELVLEKDYFSIS